VTSHRFLTTAAFVLFTSLVAASPAMADTGPAELILTLGNEALGVIRADMTPAQKRAFFHQLLQQNFDARPVLACQASLKSASFEGFSRIISSAFTVSDLRNIAVKPSE